MIQAFTSRRLETAAAEAAAYANENGETALLVFRDVAARVEPGDTAETAIASHDAAIAAIIERETEHPLLSNVDPMKGDFVQTMTSDHFVKVEAGTFGLVVSATVEESGLASKISVRFANKTVDYETADFTCLRHAHAPKR